MNGPASPPKRAFYTALGRLIVAPELPIVAGAKTGTDAGVHDEDGRSIAREWKREVEEQERLGDRGRDDGRGRAVVWLVLWLIWLVCLGAVIGWLTGHR